ncbi:MAG: AbrB/MazE/SpoVT family DNA-binding domain-containing protein [Candidatus Diapherotrites archaeon]|nr:AbrB/MazE/SpoVT family DNA-binding domain-containing protein [Candidatus Diapherotrites archaeon]
MNCTKCRNKMIKKKGITPEGFEYTYSKCVECGEEIVDLKQLHEVANKYRYMKKYSVKISKWGDSLAMRIPKELAKEYNIKSDERITLIPEKKSIKIITP